MGNFFAPNLKKDHTVFPEKLAGGPHGLGDPRDQSLRKVEQNILIPNKVREKSRHHKCKEEMTNYLKCTEEYPWLFPMKCRPENTVLIACLGRWFEDKELNEECKKEYLHERTVFRETGVSIAKKKKAERVT